jgi:hypothetical protein
MDDSTFLLARSYLVRIVMVGMNDENVPYDSSYCPRQTKQRKRLRRVRIVRQVSYCRFDNGNVPIQRARETAIKE